MMLEQYDQLYGLIGYPLSHSFSKAYFGRKFQTEGRTDAFYELFPLSEIQQLPALLQQHSNLRGLNVTIPYKEAVFPYLDQIDPAAERVGAVNTIRVVEGKLTGYNTDVYGFGESLRRLGQAHQRHFSKALILGTGGAAKAVAFVFQEQNIAYQLVSRQPGTDRLTYDQLNRKILAEYPLIVNTTPLGMAPREATCPDLPYEQLTAENTLFDLVYNPEKTLFLERGEQKGCLIQNGLEMLYLQAEGAWSIWQQ